MIKQIKFLLIFNILQVIRNPRELISAIGFFIISLIFFHIAIGPDEIDYNIKIGLLVVILNFSMILTSDIIFKIDKDDGFLESIIASKISTVNYTISKIIMFGLFNIILTTIALALSALLYNFSAIEIINISKIFTLAILGLSMIIGFMNSLLLGSVNKFLLTLLTLSFAVPLNIITTLSCINYEYILMLIGLDLIYIPLLGYFTMLALKENANYL